MTRNPEDTRYGRCEATAKTTGKRCGRAAVGDHGKCDIHGGKSPSGEDHPDFTHGIYSGVVRDDDRAVLDALEDISTAKKLDETLNLQVMKLRRAVAMLDDPDRESNFWQLFQQLVDNVSAGEQLEPGQVQELAQLLDTPHRAQRDLMDLIRKTAKTLHDITEGQDINVSHGIDEESIDELKDLAEAAYE